MRDEPVNDPRDDQTRVRSSVRVAKTRSGYVWSVFVAVGDDEEKVRKAAEVVCRIEAELADRYGRTEGS
jgi:hypothetical protein